jgi:hypothetical protein
MASAMGYSATVEIELFVNGQRFPVAQCSRDFLIFDEPVMLPGTEAELVLTIDGHARCWKMALPESAIPSTKIQGIMEPKNS